MPDIAIIKFATPLAGPEIHVGSVKEGDIVEAAGFGVPGYPGSLPLLEDGFSRGWQARSYSWAIDANVSDTYYIGALFGELNEGLALNAKGTIGDSGGPWFNAAGELVGISVAATHGTDDVGSTDFLNLSNPEVHAWIMQNTAVPEPGAFVLLAAGGALGVLLKRGDRES